MVTDQQAQIFALCFKCDLRCFSVRVVQLPRCFSCGQGRAAPLLLFVRAVQLFFSFRGNRPAVGARWVDVTSPLWATDNLTNRHILTSGSPCHRSWHSWTAEFLYIFWQADFPAIQAALLLFLFSVLREEFASLFQTFSRNDLPGEAALARGRYVLKKKKKEKIWKKYQKRWTHD